MRGDPVIPVVCDNPDCGMSQNFDMTALGRVEAGLILLGSCWNEQELTRQMDAAGWETVDDEEHYCPECAEDRAAERESEP